MAIPLANKTANAIERVGASISSLNRLREFNLVTHEEFQKLNWTKMSNAFLHNFFAQGLDAKQVLKYFCKGCGRSYTRPATFGGGAGGCRAHVEQCTSLKIFFKMSDEQSTLNFTPVKSNMPFINDLFAL